MLDLHKIPKIDLHCHLDGSLSIQSMEQYLRRTLLPEEVTVSSSCSSLTGYLTRFTIPLQCIQTEQGLENAAYSFLKQLTDDAVKYVEVRFAPLFSLQQGLTGKQVIESVLRGLERGKTETGISYGLILCAMRHFSMDENVETLNYAASYLKKGVCALDLAGDENHYPNTLFQELFQETKKLQVPYVIHSGETGNVENVRLAVDYGAARIGHGLALIQDPDLMKEIALKGIGIEMCPTSNLQTKACASLEDYPLKTFLDAGIKVTVNTDNRTVSQTTVTRELELIQQLYHDDGIIQELLRNAEETSFLL